MIYKFDNTKEMISKLIITKLSNLVKQPFLRHIYIFHIQFIVQGRVPGYARTDL